MTYDLAMLAETGAVDEMERLLRRGHRLRTRPPPRHQRLLGYFRWPTAILRLDEARQLILKALEYWPRRPLHHRQPGMGRVPRRQSGGALPIAGTPPPGDKPDAEIAATWAKCCGCIGEPDRALAIWRQGLGLARTTKRCWKPSSGCASRRDRPAVPGRAGTGRSDPGCCRVCARQGGRSPHPALDWATAREVIRPPQAFSQPARELDGPAAGRLQRCPPAGHGLARMHTGRRGRRTLTGSQGDSTFRRRIRPRSPGATATGADLFDCAVRGAAAGFAEGWTVGRPDRAGRGA